MQTQQLQPRGKNNPDMEDTSIAHLAGVFDTIGTVTVHVSENDKYRIGYQFQPVLRLIRPMNDDPLLGKVMAYCEENGVRYSLSEKSHGPGADTKSHEWVCKDPDSIERFFEPMLPYLVTKYEPAMVMIKEITPRVKDDKHLEKEGLYELMEYADMIREPIRRGTEIKYSQKYFEKEWSIAE